MGYNSLQHPQPLILIVDDDVANCLFIEAALVQSGFSVAVAHDGYSALKHFDKRPPDLVLLDIQMPNMNGFETCERIRRLHNATSTSVIMMTALDDDDSINRAFEVGSASFVTKPVSPQLLIHRLRYILRATQNETKLRQSQEQLARAHSIARLGYFEYEPESAILYVSESFNTLFDLDKDTKTLKISQFMEFIEPKYQKLVKSTFALKTYQSNKIEYDIINKNAAKKTIYQETNILLNKKGDIERFFVTIQDITERKSIEAQLNYLSYVDDITELPNKSLLIKIISYKIKSASINNEIFALLSLDIDNFKRVSDSLGHNLADQLLKNLGERLCKCLRLDQKMSIQNYEDLGISSCMREKDCVARIDGDGFVVLLSSIHSPQDAAKAAERISQALMSPFILGEHEILVTLSVGISVFPQDGRDAETLLRSANSALHHAQQDDRSAFSFYTASLNEEATRRLSLETKLRKAIENEEFIVFFQPRIDLLTGNVVSAEALVRWYDPDEGLIPPGAFITIAEETGLIVPIGEWVLRTTCAHMTRWRSAGLHINSISVNLSAVQFKQQNLFDVVKDAMDRDKIQPGSLEFEITESTLVADFDESIEILRRLESIGVHLSIDDFGTGYSSLSYLKRFPLTSLKVDQSFVKDIEVCADDTAIVKAIIGLAKSLRLRVVAEGIETEAQLAFLRANGCDEGQGFLFSPPMPAHEFIKWLRAKAA